MTPGHTTAQALEFDSAQTKRPTTRMSHPGLRHPIWWAALALLLLNDHVLKGAGLLPGAVTGKLSDFAGLIVAPVLLTAVAAALGARGRAARAVCFTLVAAVFAAINIWPEAARALEQALAVTGIVFRKWTDPSDLIALAVLPVAWAICSGRTAATAPRALLERTGMVVATLACVATSPVGMEGWTTTSFVVNRTERAIDIRVRWIDATMECRDVAGMAATALSRDAFGEGVTFRLEPGDVIPLERGRATQEPMPPPNAGCEAVRVQADGLAETVVFWAGQEDQVVASNINGGAVSGGIDLAPDEDGRLALRSRNRRLEVTEAVETPEPARCASGAEPLSFEWSALPILSSEPQRLLDAEVGPDGCLVLRFADPGDGDREWTLFLCIPAAELPFSAGDAIDVEALTTPARLVLRGVPEAGEPPDGAPYLVVFHGTAGLSITEPGSGGIVMNVNALECEGERTACGGFRRPAALAGSGMTVLPGETGEVEGSDGSGERFRVSVGRAEEIVVAHPSCSGGREALGPLLDAVVVRLPGG